MIRHGLLRQLVGAVALLAAGAACAGPSAPAAAPSASAARTTAAPDAPTTATASPPRTLSFTVVQGVQTFVWPVLVAKEEGFLARQGLDVDFSYANSISEQMQIMASGSVDLGFAAPSIQITAVEHGANLVAVGGLVNLATYSLIVGPGLHSYDDVRGKLVVVSGPHTPDVQIVTRMLAREGLTQGTDYDLLPLAAPPSRYAAVKNGQAAAMLVPQPTDVQAVSEGMQRIGFAPDVIELAFSSLVTRRDWAADNHDVLVRFLVALRDGARWLYQPEHRARAVEILAQDANITPEIADGTYEVMVSRVPALTREGEIDRQRFANWFDLLVESGDLTPPLPSLDKYVDESYWREAMQR
ncbi:MAG TPA: ABC transporter substrate-binding protein [Chloroflexota bacterium]|jgi:NitT/TauT family transport system substrate-binding protein